MNPITLTALGNHLWQSTVVTAVAGLLAWMLRKHGAHVRYGVWFTASVKFLVPFWLLIALGSAVSRESARPDRAMPSIVTTATEIAQPFVVQTVSGEGGVTVPGTIYKYLPGALFGAWLLGFLIIVMLWARSWLRVRSIVRGASPVAISTGVEAMASPEVQEPSVFGVFRPVLLVPRDLRERLSEDQLHSVVAHEMCHIRRRDNLLSSIHMTVAAIFWFYPVVWWLGARLLEERERACDEEVLRLGSDPLTYAESILRICRSYRRSPLTCMSGIAGPHLQKRIEAIVRDKIECKLNPARKMFLIGAGFAVLAAPVVVGATMGRPLQPQVQAPQSQRTVAAASPALEVASISATVSTPEPHTLPRQAAVITQKEQPPVAGTSEDRRMEILFFDLSALRTEELPHAKEAAKKYIDNKRPADLVSVVAHSASLSVLQDFTPDNQKLDDAIDGIGPQDGRNDSVSSVPGAPDRLRALMDLARTLKPIPDKKMVIYFVGDVELRGTPDQSALRDTIRAAQEANLSIYTVSVRGIDQH